MDPTRSAAADGPTSSTRRSRLLVVALVVATVTTSVGAVALPAGATADAPRVAASDGEVRAVEVEYGADRDGDGYATVEAVVVRVDARLPDADLEGRNPGEPYLVVELDGREVARTDELATEGGTVRVPVDDAALRDVAAGNRTLTVRLLDRDPGDDDPIDDRSVPVRFERPLDVEAGRASTVAGSPVSLRVVGRSGDVTWRVVDRPDGSDATVVAHHEATADLRPDVAGKYVVEVRPTAGPGGGEPARITIEARDDGRLSLLRRYAPILHYAAAERYHPTRYESFVYNAELEDALNANDPTPTTFELGERDGDWELELKGSESDYPAYQADYPPTVYGSVHRNVTFRGREYTALTYWLFYVYDPKQKGDLSGLFAHQSDLESVTVLLNDSGPQWVGASQHYGGERREWSKAPKSGTHLHVYPALGAHSNYLADTGRYRGRGLLPQEQFVNQSGGLPVLLEWAVDQYVDRTGDAMVYAPDDRGDRRYEVAVLTGEEVWAGYEGAFGPDDGKGRVPMRRDRWTDPGRWMETAVISDESQRGADVRVGGTTLNDTVVSTNLTVANTGLKPHRYWAVLEARREGETWAEARELSVVAIPVGTLRSTSRVLSGDLPAAGDWTVRIRVLAYRPEQSEPEDVMATATLPGPIRIAQGQVTAGPETVGNGTADPVSPTPEAVAWPPLELLAPVGLVISTVLGLILAVAVLVQRRRRRPG